MCVRLLWIYNILVRKPASIENYFMALRTRYAAQFLKHNSRAGPF